MNITELFRSIQRKLEAELTETRSAIEHAASKGSANEETVRQFLRSRMPRTVDISHGFLIDTQGNVSRQLDVIIHDASKTPIFYEKDGLRVIPIECAYAVVEVKTNLSVQEVESCWGNMSSVKAMAKSAFYDEGAVVRPTEAYGKSYQDWPVMYFVFSFDAAPLSSIALRLKELTYSNNAALDKRIDCVFSVQRGLLANFNGYISALPSPNSHFVSIKDDALFMFYSLISQFMNQTYMRNFSFHPYIRHTQWTIEHHR